MGGTRRLAVALAMTVAAFGAAAETVRWERTPIPLRLEVGRERMVVFPRGGEVGIPRELAQSGALRVAFVNDTAYWNAYAPFEAYRVPVRLSDGMVVLFDVSAGTGAAGGTLRVVRPGDDADLAVGGLAAGGGDAAAPSDGERMLRLIRFAVQQDYAPARVAGTLPGAARASADVEGDLSRLYRHADAGRIEVRLRSCWTAFGLHVAGLEFVNTGDAAVDLDPRLLQHAAGPEVNGFARRFVAAGWLASTLAAAGRPGSATMVYVVTRRPFAETVRL